MIWGAPTTWNAYTKRLRPIWRSALDQAEAHSFEVIANVMDHSRRLLVAHLGRLPRSHANARVADGFGLRDGLRAGEPAGSSVTMTGFLVDTAVTSKGTLPLFAVLRQSALGDGTRNSCGATYVSEIKQSDRCGTYRGVPNLLARGVRGVLLAFTPPPKTAIRPSVPTPWSKELRGVVVGFTDWGVQVLSVMSLLLMARGEGDTLAVELDSSFFAVPVSGVTARADGDKSQRASGTSAERRFESD